MTDEVLIHISAPATRKNDTLYQSLAEAYLEFESARFHTNKDSQNDACLLTTSDSNLCTTVMQGSSTPAAAGASVFTCSKDSYGSFPSFVSSGGQVKDNEQASEPPQPALAEHSQLPVSSRLAQLEQIHVNWRNQTHQKYSTMEGQRHALFQLADVNNAGTSFIEDTQLAEQALQSQLQDTYSVTSEDFQEGEFESAEIDQQVQQTNIKEGKHPANRSNEEVLASAPLRENAAFDGVSVVDRKSANDNRNLALSGHIDRVDQSSLQRSKDHHTFVPILDFSKLPIDAFPPAPKVSIECPGTLPSQVTKHLAVIKSQNPARFQPLSEKRRLQPDERGYWSVDCSSWSVESQHEFWLSLREHVLDGRLGWGTTLHRDCSSIQALGQIKLYCWGEVVEHMWLALWICSKGKISSSKSMWYDADGIPVVKVP